jgi:hypothetical protein
MNNKTSAIKKRHLLNDPVKQELCLDELVHMLIGCSKPLAILEHKNTGPALIGAKKALNEFKKKFIEYETRIKTTITYEVKEEISKKDKSIVYGNPSKIVPYQNKSKE